MKTTILLAALLLLPTLAWAQNGSVGNNVGISYEPYAQALGPRLDEMAQACADHGINLTPLMQTTYGSWGWFDLIGFDGIPDTFLLLDRPDLNMLLFDTTIGLSAGVLAYFGHGPKLAVESYPVDNFGEDACMASYNMYFNDGETGIAVCETSHGWHVGELKGRIHANYNSNLSLATIFACGSSQDHAYSFAASRVTCYYTSPVLVSTAISDETDFYHMMGEGYGAPSEMVVEEAVCGTSLSTDGLTNTTMGPFTDIGMFELDNSNWASKQFDMMLGLNTNSMGSPYMISNTPGIAVVQSTWMPDATTVRARIQATGVGEAEFYLFSNTVYAANASSLYLQGGRDITITLEIDDGPDASIDYFTVSDGVATFEVSAVNRTESFVIQGGSGGEWEDLVALEENGTGIYSAPVNGAENFRLTEVEDGGHVLYHRTAMPDVEMHIEYEAVAAPADALMYAREQFEGKEIKAMSRLVGGRLVAYAPSEFISTIESHYEYWLELAGMDVEIIPIDGFWGGTDNDNTFITAIKASIAAEISQGTTYFTLFGDHADKAFLTIWPTIYGWRDRQLGYTNYEVDLTRHIIPTIVVWDVRPQETNQGGYRPYYEADALYFDTDGNGAKEPGIKWGRIPVATVSELQGYLAKWQVAFNSGWSSGTYRVGFMVGDENHDLPNDEGHGDGDNASDIAQRLASARLGGQQIEWIKESDFSNPYTRMLGSVEFYNYENPELILLIASYNNRYWWADGFFDKTVGFHESMLTPYANHCPVMLLLSCDAASGRAEHPTYKTPVAKDVFLAPDRGPSVVVGGNGRCRQNGNEVLMDHILEYLLVPDVSVGDAVSMAMDRVWDERSETEYFMVENANSQSFWGCPTLTVNNLAVVTDVPENVQRFGLGNHPNPFNPRTKISYSLSQFGPVNVSVYNVGGERIAVLVDEVKPAGEHSVVWDGTDDHGRSMASGLYFCRMEAGGKSLNQKMTLLK